MQWRFKLKHYSNKHEKYFCFIVNTDRKIFGQMERGEITYASGLKQFKENNEIEDDIPMEEFIAWLQTLGWRV